MWKENQARARSQEAQLGQNILPGVVGFLTVPTAAHTGASAALNYPDSSSTHPTSLKSGAWPCPYSRFYPVVTPQHSWTWADVSETVSEKGAPDASG